MGDLGPVADLPDGVVDAALRWRRMAATILDEPAPPPRAAVARDLVLPLAAEPAWPGPAAPTPVPGGWVQADLIDDDRDTWHRLRAVSPDADPEGLAAAAQELRLPVLPYRAARWPGPSPRPEPVVRLPGGLEGRTVVDLTSLWAGPLVTRLLAQAGARVVKIDPQCRPDGFRAWSSLYDELNGGKEIVDLDLRQPADRQAFEAVIADADLLVSSLSRRVLLNLGYDQATLRAHNARLGTLAIVGFPRGCPEQDWLAFGTGIHAVCGRGMADGRPRPTPVAYPDGLAGHAGFVRALELLGSGQHDEVSLVESVAAAGG